MKRALDLLPVYWLTRDRFDGELSPIIEVWGVRPERNLSEDGDVMWLAPMEYLTGEREGETHVDDLTLDEARALVGNGFPDTDRECTRIGPPPPVAHA